MPTTTQTNKSIAPTSVITGSADLLNAATASPETTAPTNTVKILDAGSEGARLTQVYSAIRATTVAGRIYLFRGSDAAGTVKRLLKSRLLTAYTHSTTSADPTIGNQPDFGYSETAPLLLGPGESLWAGCSIAQTSTPIAIHAEGGRYNTP
jgi:hypothetical protein